MDQSYSDDMHSHPAGDEAGNHQAVLREKPDGITDPAGEAGWYLERERLSRGLSLDDIASCTGIHPYHVEAIEYGDMTHMPPRLEALEMIAAYADFLGFDPDPLLHHYASFLPSPEVAPRHHPANPAPMMSAKVLPFGKFPKIPPIDFRAIRLPTPSRLPGGRSGIVASVAVAVMLLAGGTYMYSGDSATGPDLQQMAADSDPMPTATTGQDIADVKVTDTPIAEPTTTTAEAEPITEIPMPGTGETDADQPVAAGEETGDLGAFIAEQVEGSADPQTVSATSKPVEIASATPGAGKVFGSEDADVHVVLKATKAIWLLIEDGQGNRVATQMLNAGDTYRVPNREGLVAIAQDGGSIVYSIDGVEKGVLGLPGSLLAAEPLDVKALAAKG